MADSKKEKVPAIQQRKPQTYSLAMTPDETAAEARGRTLVSPAVNAASTMQSYQEFLGEDIDVMATIDAIDRSAERIKGGDLSDLESMLVSQAIALQTIFTSLARRAQVQSHQRHLEAFLGLALKAQAQSRATVSALVDLKYPRQVAFVKQTNITTGNQQVNNGATSDANPEQDTPVRRHAGDSATAQNKLMEKKPGPPIQRMDARAAPAPERGHQTVETVEPIHRAEKPQR